MGSVVEGSRGSSQELRGWEVWWSGGLEVWGLGGMEAGAGDTYIRSMEEEQEDNGGGARGQPEAGQESCRLIGWQVKLFPTRKGSIRSIIYY